MLISGVEVNLFKFRELIGWFEGDDLCCWSDIK